MPPKDPTTLYLGTTTGLLTLKLSKELSENSVFKSHSHQLIEGGVYQLWTNENGTRLFSVNEKGLLRTETKIDKALIPENIIQFLQNYSSLLILLTLGGTLLYGSYGFTEESQMAFLSWLWVRPVQNRRTFLRESFLGMAGAIFGLRGISGQAQELDLPEADKLKELKDSLLNKESPPSFMMGDSPYHLYAPLAARMEYIPRHEREKRGLLNLGQTDLERANSAVRRRLERFFPDIRQNRINRRFGTNTYPENPIKDPKARDLGLEMLVDAFLYVYQQGQAKELLPYIQDPENFGARQNESGP